MLANLVYKQKCIKFPVTPLVVGSSIAAFKSNCLSRWFGQMYLNENTFEKNGEKKKKL